MAGDWIKMRSNLWDDPRVARLCDMTDQSEAAIVGALYWLWATADQHTEDGVMPGLSLRQIDRKTGVDGFGKALCDIGWLADHPEGVRIVGFEEHNGSSAKRRCSESRRKMSARDADIVLTDGGQPAEETQQTCAPREEKRREEIQEPPPPSVAPPLAKSPAAKVPCPDGVNAQVWADWLSLRKAKRAPVTATTVQGAETEAGKAGLTLEAFLRVWCARGSQGLQADWLKPHERGSPPPQHHRPLSPGEARMLEACPSLVSDSVKQRAAATQPKFEVIDATPAPAIRLG